MGPHPWGCSKPALPDTALSRGVSQLRWGYLGHFCHEQRGAARAVPEVLNNSLQAQGFNTQQSWGNKLFRKPQVKITSVSLGMPEPVVGFLGWGVMRVTWNFTVNTQMSSRTVVPFWSLSRLGVLWLGAF